MKTTYLLHAISTTVLAALLTLSSAAQTRVEILPAAVYANKGDTVKLAVQVSDAVGLRGASVHVKFQKSILRFLSAEEGDFLTKNPEGFTVAFFVTERPVGSPDSVLVDQAIMGLSAVDGSGLLFTLRFIAEQGGSTEVAVKGMDLRNIDNAKIEAEGSGASVSVNSGNNLAPSKPVLLTPPDGARLAALPDTFRWSSSSDPEQDPVRYLLRISGPGSDTAFTDLTDTAFVLSAALLRPEKTYYWYVEARDPYSVVRSDATFRFTTPATSGLECTAARPESMLIQVYPNPARDEMFIRYTAPRAMRIRLYVIDMLGRGSAVIADMECAPGVNECAADLSALPGGVYRCVLQAGGMVSSRSILLHR